MSTLKEETLESLKSIGAWSTSKEVYEYMVQNNKGLGSSKTPFNSVSATLAISSQKGDIKCRKSYNGTYIYGFPDWENSSIKIPLLNKTVSQTLDIATSQVFDNGVKKESIKERDLHQLLCNYLWDKQEYSKTIYQERSNRNDSAQKWVHPDIVGVSFVDTKAFTAKELLKATKTNETMRLCSYEMKIRLMNDYELKQAYFQALSNSNWANFGYLVAFEISEDNDMLDEMERLNQSFGIGIIKLGVTQNRTRILFPAKKKELDFRTIDKLCGINPEFDKFIGKVTNVITAEKKFIDDLKKGLMEICDHPLLDEEKVKKYCKENNIPFDEGK
ncbi:MAG TPA: hypothetical protein DDY68_05860 [Porphyromonadaceae bacterium]|nr:hypothetical protein [Porphyromonadaceae bacterium]